ncbi:MAG: hypothetical protein AAB367_01320 [Patescibacteria group bacterium]
MDDLEAYNKVQSSVPNIPEEVVRLWLLPWVKTLGWPPSGRIWNLRLGGESIAFWNDATWKKEKLHLPSLPYSPGYFDTMQGLHEAYIQGKENPYSRDLGENGRRRFHRSLKYIVKHRIFPKPPILYPNEIEKYEIMDGNHRFFALIAATRISEEIAEYALEEKKMFLEKMDIAELLPPENIQEVWVCRPNWENSANAKTRKYLRDNGIDFI